MAWGEGGWIPVAVRMVGLGGELNLFLYNDFRRMACWLFAVSVSSPLEAGEPNGMIKGLSCYGIALLAQLAEQLTLNQRVVGSSPTGALAQRMRWAFFVRIAWHGFASHC